MRRILVVDDSSTLRKMVRASLQTIPDSLFDEAASGLEAIEKLSLGRPDLIMLDINMPDMHGLELLRFVRSHPTYLNIPVIVLTTRGDDALRTECLASGASRFCTKPFIPKNLAEEAASLLASTPQ